MSETFESITDDEVDAFVDLYYTETGHELYRNRTRMALEQFIAARIAAKRVPVSDEVLTETIQYVLNDLGIWQNIAPHIAGAVRAAIGPTVPVIPEGWRLDAIEYGQIDYESGEPSIRGYVVTLTGPGDAEIIASGLDWHEALTAACEAAQGVEP